MSNTKREKHAGGRPTKYRKEFAEQARKLCLLGATDEELADFFEVQVRTVQTWKKTHKEFLHSIKNGKQVADAEVASKLFHRATGYEHPDSDVKVINENVVITPLTKHYPPDATAAIFWLKNRQPEKWRDKKDLSIDGNMEVEVTMDI